MSSAGGRLALRKPSARGSGASSAGSVGAEGFAFEAVAELALAEGREAFASAAGLEAEAGS